MLSNEEKKFSIPRTIICILSENSNRRLPIELPVAKEPRLQVILNYMQDQTTEQISISQISNQFGFSERSLLRLFQEDLKMSYAQYLKTLRVVRAIELLTITNLSINEISFQVVMIAFPTFSNTFQDLVGVRPKVYRQ